MNCLSALVEAGLMAPGTVLRDDNCRHAMTVPADGTVALGQVNSMLLEATGGRLRGVNLWGTESEDISYLGA